MLSVLMLMLIAYAGLLKFVIDGFSVNFFLMWRSSQDSAKGSVSAG